MRPLAIVCGLLLAACSTTTTAKTSQPQPEARVVYRDLNLRDADDQLVLVERVRQAAVDYCHDHAALVTPSNRLGDARHCAAVMRVQLMQAMPPRVRHAYDAGWRRRPLRRA